MTPARRVGSTLAFVLAVAAAPRSWWPVYVVAAVVLVATTVATRTPLRTIGRRLRLELPFLAFAVFLPVVGSDPRIDVLSVSLSKPGLLAAATIAVKATLGLLAVVLLTATTPTPTILRGLERLHVPKLLTAIAGFMLRYVEVLADDARRMRIARLSRAHDPRWLWEARAVATTAGALFVRSYERGERVHQAMVARGYDGTMPDL